MARERYGNEATYIGVTLARVNSEPRFCKVSKRLVANGFVLVLYLHMKTRKSRGLPLTNSKNGTRSLQVVERGTRGRKWREGNLLAATLTVAQVAALASVVLNIQWRHVPNSTDAD